MRVSVEPGEGLERRLSVDLPAEPVTEAVNAKLNELSPKVRLPGFRSGKVPMRIIRQRFHQSVLEEVSRDLMESSYQEAIAQKALKPAGSPSKLERHDPAAETGGLSYTATLEVFPEVVLQDFAGHTLVDRQCEIMAADVDETIQRIREQHAGEKSIDRPAQLGDTLRINFSTEVETGDALRYGADDNVSINLGDDSGFPQEVREGLIGAVADEERTIRATLKADAAGHDDQLVHYTVRVLKVVEPDLPELDEAFIQSIGIEDGTEATFRREVEDNLRIELANKLQELRRIEAFNLWLKVNPLDLPQVLIFRQAAALRDDWLDRLGAAAEQRDELNSIPVEACVPQARRQVWLGLLLNQWMEDQNIQVSDDELQAQAEANARQYANPAEMVANALRDSQVRDQLREQVIENKLVDWIFSQVEVETEVLSFAELKATPIEPVTPEKQTPEKAGAVVQDADHA